VVWQNAQIAVPSIVSQLSTSDGLEYAYAKDARGWYWAALDFQTGAVVAKSYMPWSNTEGGFLANNWYSGLTIGPDGTADAGVFGGLEAWRPQAGPQVAQQAGEAAQDRGLQVERAIRRIGAPDAVFILSGPDGAGRQQVPQLGEWQGGPGLLSSGARPDQAEGSGESAEHRGREVDLFYANYASSAAGSQRTSAGSMASLSELDSDALGYVFDF
jgi:hypothetical protein